MSVQESRVINSGKEGKQVAPSQSELKRSSFWHGRYLFDFIARLEAKDSKVEHSLHTLLVLSIFTSSTLFVSGLQLPGSDLSIAE